MSFTKNLGYQSCKAIKEGEDTIYFPSIKACAKHFNRAASGISRQLKRNGFHIINEYKIIKC